MGKKILYETPQIEFTKFEQDTNIMNNNQDNGQTDDNQYIGDTSTPDVNVDLPTGW